VVQVNDLIEPRPEEIVLPAVSPLLGPHRIASAKPTDRITTKQPDQFARNQADSRRSLANAMTRRSSLTLENQPPPESSRATS
jgi:hypothetical protein